MLAVAGINSTELKFITTLWSIDPLAQEITVNHNEH